MGLLVQEYCTWHKNICWGPILVHQFCILCNQSFRNFLRFLYLYMFSILQANCQSYSACEELMSVHGLSSGSSRASHPYLRAWVSYIYIIWKRAPCNYPAKVVRLPYNWYTVPIVPFHSPFLEIIITPFSQWCLRKNGRYTFRPTALFVYPCRKCFICTPASSHMSRIRHTRSVVCACISSFLLTHSVTHPFPELRSYIIIRRN